MNEPMFHKYAKFYAVRLTMGGNDSRNDLPMYRVVLRCPTLIK